VINVHGVLDDMQMDIHTSGSLVPEPSFVELEIDTETVKRYKSAGFDYIPAEFIKVGGEILRSEIKKIIRSLSNEEELPQQWKETIIVPNYKNGLSYQIPTKCYPG
jgi:hypothetical protein